ncbi:hypothetical protein ACFLRI_03555 [Bacteroidota bacterium]
MKKVDKFHIFLFIFLTQASFTFSQDTINYLAIRDSITLEVDDFENYCKILVSRFQSIETLNITKGKGEFYYDFGLALNCLRSTSENDSLLHKSIEFLLKSINENSIYKGSAYGLLTIQYAWLEDCNKVTEYFNLYRKNEQRKNWNKAVFKTYRKMKKNCS